MDKNFIKEWNNVKEISDTLNTHRSNIYRVCKGEQKSACGYIWMHKDDYINKKDNLKIFKPNRGLPKQLVQLTLKGEFINEWESMSQASRNTGVRLSGISDVCNGKRNKAGGYKWMYREDYDKYIANQSKKLINK
ncbi:hypothetical protein NST17_19915 [Caldifermentibacillus hisashii]|uniref:Nuclease-associated modular DNA-binding 1 domain-containing protein n=1 Tax=Caldifermentibacillus hisashii TaxID=996558 RepID=A0ABU9K2R8_9BACI